MSRLGYLIVVVTVLALGLPGIVSAEQEVTEKTDFTWEEITAADWAIGQDTAWPGAHAIMIFERISVDDRLIADRVALSLYRRIRILNEAGRSYADVNASIDFGEQKVNQVIGRTVLPDGNVTELTPEGIHRETIVRTEGGKIDQTRFSIPGVTSDCIVEYRITYDPGQSSDVWLIQKDIPLVKGEYQWYYSNFALLWDLLYEWMPFLELQKPVPEYVWRNTPSRSPKRFPLAKDTTEMIFSVQNVAPFARELFSLPEKALAAQLRCSYGSGSLPIEFWSDRTRAIEKWMRVAFCRETNRVKKVMSKMSGTGDLEQTMHEGYSWVQQNIINTSYVDLAEARHEKGLTGKKKEKENRSADDVMGRGYGSREDLTALYCAMLREMGVDARLAYAVDRTDDIFVRDIKSWQFDRALVAVFDSTKNVRFFAPGVPYVPYGMVPWFNEGVQVLLEGTQGELLTVPPSAPEATVENHLYNYTFVPGEEVKGTTQSRLTGHAAGYIRGRMLGCDTLELRDLLKESAADFLTDAKYDSLICEGLKDVEGPLKLGGNAVFPAISEQAGRLLFKPLDYFVKRDNPFVSATRKTPIVFRSAYQRKEAAQFELPEGWSIEALPADTMFTNRVGKCGVQFMQLGNKLSVQRSFALNAPMWKVEDYRDVRALFQARQEMSDRIVVLRKN